jgi:hypothetical protein
MLERFVHNLNKTGRPGGMRVFAPLVIAGLALPAIGCGGNTDLPEMADVSGTVTVGSQPLQNAVVTFTPQAGGRPSSGTTDESGYYELMYTRDESGAMLGQHVVRIQRMDQDEADSRQQDETTTGLPPAAGDGSLVKEVTAGSNEIDITL